MVFPNRFKSVLDECMHIIVGLLLSDIYELQKSELIDSYGPDVVEEAYNAVTNDYKMLFARF